MLASEPGPTRLPFDDGTGGYADDVVVWTSPHGIGMDLFVLGPWDEDEVGRVAYPVTRIRLPSSIILPMMTALIDALDVLEKSRGSER